MTEPVERTLASSCSSGATCTRSGASTCTAGRSSRGRSRSHDAAAAPACSSRPRRCRTAPNLGVYVEVEERRRLPTAPEPVDALVSDRRASRVPGRSRRPAAHLEALDARCAPHHGVLARRRSARGGGPARAARGRAATSRSRGRSRRSRPGSGTGSIRRLTASCSVSTGSRCRRLGLWIVRGAGGASCRRMTGVTSRPRPQPLPAPSSRPRSRLRDRRGRLPNINR